eukprot:SAG25_NODE_1695_length_2530_cov_1.901687_4_plen_120_part_00
MGGQLPLLAPVGAALRAEAAQAGQQSTAAGRAGVGPEAVVVPVEQQPQPPPSRGVCTTGGAWVIEQRLENLETVRTTSCFPVCPPRICGGFMSLRPFALHLAYTSDPSSLLRIRRCTGE